MTTFRYNFNGGELAPELRYRPDLARFSTALERCDNFELTHYGALQRRGGIRLVRFLAGLGDSNLFFGGTYDGVRILPFVAGAANRFAVVLLTSDGRCDFAAIDIDTGNTLWSTAGEASAPTTYTAAQIREVQFVHANDVMYLVHADHAPMRIERDDDGWSIAEAEINGGPWIEDYAGQPEMTLTDSTPEWTNSTTYNANDVVRDRNGTARWTCTVTHGSTLAREPDAGSTYLDYWEKSDDLTGYTLTSSDNLFSSDWVGTKLRIRAETQQEQDVTFSATTTAYDLDDPDSNLAALIGPYPCSASVKLKTFGGWAGKFAMDLSYDDWATYDTIYIAASYAGNLQNYDVTLDTPGYGGQVRVRVLDTITTAACRVQLIFSGDTYSYLQITGYTNATTVTVSRLDYRQDLFSDADVWNEGQFSSKNGYPGSAVIHEERLWFGGTPRRPQTMHASRLNDWTDFAFGEDSNAPISATLQTENRNACRWLASGKTLVVGTDLSNFLVQGRDTNTAIGPGNIQVTREDAYGAALIQPIWGGPILYYVQAGGEQVRALYYEFARDSYQSDEASLLARHLLEDGIAELAGGNERLYALTTTGEVRIYTYDRQQEISGWARLVPAGTGFTIESITSIAGPSRPDIAMVIRDADDRCWLAVLDESPSHYLDYVSEATLTTARAIQVVQETYRPRNTANDAYLDSSGDAVTLIDTALMLITSTESTTWRLYSATEPTITPKMRAINQYDGGAAATSGVTTTGTLLATTELTKAQFAAGSYTLQYDNGGGWTNAASVEHEDLDSCTFAIASPSAAFSLTPSCPLGDGYLVLDIGLVSLNDDLQTPVKLLPLVAGSYTIENATDHAYTSQAQVLTLNWGDGTLGKRSRLNRLSLYLVNSEGGSADIGESGDVHTVALPTGALDGEHELPANSGYVDRLYLRIHTSADAAFRLAAIGAELQRYER